jgi:hypothetical protein
MNALNARFAIAVALIGFGLIACKPADPPPDLLKGQRDALNQAKAVEGQLQQAQDRMKAAEESQK